VNEDIRNPIDVFDTQLLTSNQRGLNEMIDYFGLSVVSESFCIPRTENTFIGLVGGLRWVRIKKNRFSSYTLSIKLINQIKPLCCCQEFCEHDNNLINIVKLNDI